MAAVEIMSSERMLRRQAEQSGLFAYLSDGPATLREMQDLLGCSPDRVREFVRQMLSAGLLEQYEEFYWKRVYR